MGSIDNIIVGLGNPGKEYENSRHNAGFMAIDYILAKLGLEANHKKFKSLCALASVKFPGREAKKTLFLKPQTYMNLSGEAVLAVMSFYKVLPENILLIFDDICLPVGKIRVRKSGSHGGQNGVKNIINLCGNSNFPRIKIGIGDKPDKSWKLEDWVISNFTKTEKTIVNERMIDVYSSVAMILDGKTDEAMSKYN